MCIIYMCSITDLYFKHILSQAPPTQNWVAIYNYTRNTHAHHASRQMYTIYM